MKDLRKIFHFYDDQVRSYSLSSYEGLPSYSFFILGPTALIRHFSSFLFHSPLYI